jgi:phosphoglycerate dehydrogenase-like enzyme
MKIGFVTPGRYLPLPDELASAFPEMTFVTAAEPDGIASHFADLDALVISTVLYDADVARKLTEKAGRLRWLQVMSSGVDSILDAGVPPKAVLTSASGIHANAVADHAMALLLGLIRGVPEMLAHQKVGSWKRKHLEATVWALEGRTVLVPGFGPIGRAVCRRLLAADAEPIAFNRAGGESGMEGVALARLDQLADYLPRADAMVLCLPGESALDGMIGARQLAAMPDHAIVVNIGRGNLIDQPALAAALAAGSIGGAGLDVYDPEPLPDGDAFWSLPNLIASPHVAGVGGQNYMHFKALLLDNIARFRDGRPLRNAVLGTGRG